MDLAVAGQYVLRPGAGAVDVSLLVPCRADQLQHTEQRFLEIARCLVMQRRMLLQPTAGLAADEIENLAALI